jgi:tetratricopeptide (TPR) repeat protein
LANVTSNIAELTRDSLGDYKQAKALYERERELRGEVLKLKANEEGRKVEMANAWGNLAITDFRAGNTDQAEAELQESQRWWDSLTDEARDHIGNKLQLAGLWERMGEAAFKRGQVDVALNHYEKALKIREEVEVVARAGKDKSFLAAVLRNVALAHMNLGDVALFLTHNAPASEAEYKIAQRFLDEAEELLPGTARGNMVLSNSLYRLGVTHEMMKKLDLSKEELKRCVDLRRALVKGDEEGMEVNASLMVALARSGEHAEAASIADEVVKRAGNEPQFLFQASCAYSMCKAAAEALAQSKPTEAAELAKGYGDKAIATLRAAVDNGWRDAMTLYVDPDLDKAREDPRFHEIVKSLDLSGITLPQGAR